MGVPAASRMAHPSRSRTTTPKSVGAPTPIYPFVAPPELGSRIAVRHAIVIVGAGTTGLTMACALAHQGITAVLVDENNSVCVKGAASRGICYTQKSLEIFQRLGIYDRIAAKGI